VSPPLATASPPLCLIVIASTLFSLAHRLLCYTISMHHLSTPDFHHADRVFIAGIECTTTAIRCIRIACLRARSFALGCLPSDRSIRSHTTYSSSNTTSLLASPFLPHLLRLLWNCGMQPYIPVVLCSTTIVEALCAGCLENSALLGLLPRPSSIGKNCVCVLISCSTHS
jgi:hypothetical protein